MNKDEFDLDGLNHDDVHMITEWHDISQRLELLKEQEMVLRKKLVARFFDGKEEGTHHAPLPEKWKLTATIKLNRSVDQAVLKDVLAELPEGSEELLIRYKPELKLKNYKALSQDDKKLFDKALTTRDGTPTLKLVEPKK